MNRAPFPGWRLNRRIRGVDGTGAGLDVQTTAVDGVAIVVVRGEIDMSTADRFAAALRSATESGMRTVRVDLGGVEFFGSEGVRELVAAQRNAGEAGVEVTVSAASGITRRVLGIVGLQSLLPGV